MSAIETGAQSPASPWRYEIRAMLALAWPMILTNLAQTAMTATDVMIIGRLGPDALAAGALGSNLYFAPLIFGLGLMYCDLADDGGRTRPQAPFGARRPPHGAPGPVAAPSSSPSRSGSCCGTPRRSCCAMGQEPKLSEQAGIYVRHLQWAVLPFYGYIVLRSFISALERPGWALVIMAVAVAANAVRQLAADVRQVGLPADGHRRLGPGDQHRQRDDVRRHGRGGDDGTEVPPLPSLRSLLAARLAALQGAALARRADLRHPRLRGHHLQRRRLPDGADQLGLAGRPCHRHPALLDHLHDPARSRARRQPCASASPMVPRTTTASPAPAGRPMCSAFPSWR